MITRRNFLKTSALASASVILLPGCLKFTRDKNGIGFQLYTVRDHISKDLPGTLEKLSRMGYNWLEAAGYNDGKFYNLPPADFKSMVENLGMKLISSHVAINPEQSQQAIDAHLELGVHYAVYPWMSMPEKPSRDDYMRKAELFNTLGQACNRAGLKFGYHNHDFEFVKIEDTTGYDILLEMTDPESVCFEADIYWMTYAKVDPMHYFKKHRGRFDLWHVKDMEDSPERAFTEVGEGTIPYKKYFDEVDRISGMNYFFIEQDTCKIDSLESAAISYSNLIRILKE
ncbi:MAG: TIM barrel protein [Bacteroidales bacterium]|nr:TIM barrel protein [Bacteroidales bacterium]